MLVFLLLLAITDDGDALLVAEPAYDEVSLTGYTRAVATMPITAEVAGRCLSVAADVGEVMGDGVFARLDDTFTTLDLERNEKVRARLANQIAYLEKELRRFEDLFQRETVSESVRDETAQRRDQAAFQLKELEVEAEVLRERRDRFVLRTGRGWRVISRDLEPGQWVAAGTTVGVAGDYRTLHVPFAVDERTYQHLREQSESVPVTLPDHDVTLTAHLARVSPAFDETTRKIGIELALRDGLPERRGGIRVTLALRLAGEAGVVLLPRSALEQRYDAYWITREDGTRLRVRMLGTAGDRVRISGEGLEPGDRFIGAPQP